MTQYRNSPGNITLEVRAGGAVSARLRYSDKGLTQKRMGDLPLSPTPLLDVCLACCDSDRFTVDELARIRDIDKSWIRLSRLFA